MIELREVTKNYRLGAVSVPALRGISLVIESGQFVAITGPSGSGKSTLMNIVGLLENADGGRYRLFDQDVSNLDADAAAFVRRKRIGFVFQFFNLIPRLSALRNVELPMVYAGIPAHERHQRAAMALRLVGLENRSHHTPAQLSGGQQQRVAIARSLVNNPDILIADEPTGSLDTATSTEVMSLLARLHDSGKTIIVVTHEDEVAAYAQRRIQIRDGRIELDWLQ